jgi:hypothetical protein
MDLLVNFLNAYTFSASTLVISAFLIAVITLIIRAHRCGAIDWVGMITVDQNGKAVPSVTKILQLVGGFVGTWIVINLTLQKGITWDIFSIYLAYVAGVDGFEKVIMLKFSNGAPANTAQQILVAPQPTYVQPMPAQAAAAKPHDDNSIA